MADPDRSDGKSVPIDWLDVYLKNLPRVFNYFRFRVGNDLVAEDLAAATFERAWRKRKQYNSDIALFESWLFGIAANLAVDHFREEAKQRSLLFNESNHVAESAEKSTELMDDFRHLVEILKSMPARDANVFAMKYGGDLTNREIAELTGLSETNVGTIAHRVVQRVRAKWGFEL